MADKEEVIINIVVSNDAATKAIYDNQQAIDRLKKSQKDLDSEFKKGTITSEEYSKKSTAVKVAIDSQKESIRQNEKELKNNIKTVNENNDSLVSMRAQLSNNVKAFDALSKAERDSAKGQELQKSINELMTNLSEAEQATGRFQRQVGKYPESFNPASQGVTQITAFFGKMGTQISAISPIAGNFINSIGGFASKAGAASEGVGSMNQTLSQSGAELHAVEGFAGKASGSLDNLASTSKASSSAISSGFSSITSGAKSMGAAFLTPPIIVISAVVLAIVAAFKLLQQGFKTNDEASDKMAESMAVLQPILDYVAKLAGAFAGVVAELVGYMVDGIATMVDFTAGLFGIKAGFSEAAEDAKNLVRAQDDLENAERDFTINSAKRATQRAKLLAEVADKEKNNAQQRIAFLKDALALDEKELVEKKRIAQQRFLILVQEAKNKNDTSIESQKQQAAAFAAAENADREYFEGKKEINKKLSAAENELDAEQQANYEKWKARKDDQLKKEQAAIRQLEDLVIQQIKDDYQRQIEAETKKTERANEDLKARLKNEENLTKAAREAINQTILENDKILIDKKIELTEKSLEENIKREIEAKNKENAAKLELSEKGSKDELNLKIARLRISKDAELNNAELTNIEKLAIENKFNEDSQALTDNYLANKYNRLKDELDKTFELKILEAQNNGLFEDEQAILELERAKKKQNDVLTMDAETKEALKISQIDYAIMVQQANKDVIDSEQAVLDAQVQKLEAFASTMKSIGSLLNAILSSMADDSEEAANFAKAIAVFNIGVALAEGIAGVVKTASKSSVTIYDYIASIAAGAASVIGTITAARKAFEPLPKKPKFATGGLISGSGTGTSDSIEARVSNGESIINARSTSMFTPLLSALNVAGGGVDFGSGQISNSVQGEEMLARAFAKGVSMLPNPIVSVKEINTVNDRVTKIKEL